MKRSSVICTLIFGALLFAVTVLCLCPQASYADAPQEVRLSYDFSAQTLAVTITHKASFPGMHHIKSVEIRKNATLISTTNYDTQPAESPFTYTFKVAAAEGDKLEVNATCNLSGSKTATLTATRTSK